VTGGVEVARDYAIANAKARPRARALRRRSLETIRRLRGRNRLDAASREFLTRHHTFLNMQGFERVDPSFKIGRVDIARGRDALERVAKFISIPCGADRQQEHPENPPLPIEMEGGLVVLADDRTKAVDSAHIMNSVHAVVRSCFSGFRNEYG
jgi:hypothetical protein